MNKREHKIWEGWLEKENAKLIEKKETQKIKRL